MKSILPSLAVWLLQVLVLQGAVNADMACGKPMASTRIVGGRNASEGRWPWQVNVLQRGNSVCGGSLIAPQWVVSAAHCFCHPQIQGQYQMQLGAFKLSEPSPNVITSDVKRIIIHPEYKGDVETGEDIALVELKSPVNYNKDIQPVCLPEASTEFPLNSSCWVTGWGYISEDEVDLPPPQVLQELKLPLSDNITCSKFLDKVLDKEELRDLKPSSVFCAGYPEGGNDTCQGDSGGPLVCKLQDSWVLAGVVSWGIGCAQPKTLGLYTSVPFYAEWIKETMNVGPHVVTPTMTTVSLPSRASLLNSLFTLFSCLCLYVFVCIS